MTFYIGAVLGGPEISGTLVDETITHLARGAKAYQEARRLRSEGSLDIVYHVPGSVMRAGFEGIRTGKFSKSEKMLMVQIAVPTLFEDDDHLKRFLVQSLREAILLAKPVFKSTKIPFAQEEYFELVDALDNEVRNREP